MTAVTRVSLAWDLGSILKTSMSNTDLNVFNIQLLFFPEVFSIEMQYSVKAIAFQYFVFTYFFQIILPKSHGLSHLIFFFNFSTRCFLSSASSI